MGVGLDSPEGVGGVETFAAVRALVDRDGGDGNGMACALAADGPADFPDAFAAAGWAFCDFDHGRYCC